MITETLNNALQSLGYPVRRIVYKLKKGEALPNTYITFQKIISQPIGYADDDSTCTVHTFGVHLFSKSDYTQLLTDTVGALKAAGFAISSMDTEIYESDTGFFHVPLIIKTLEE